MSLLNLLIRFRTKGSSFTIFILIPFLLAVIFDTIAYYKSYFRFRNRFDKGSKEKTKIEKYFKRYVLLRLLVLFLFQASSKRSLQQ